MDITRFNITFLVSSACVGDSKTNYHLYTLLCVIRKVLMRSLGIRCSDMLDGTGRLFYCKYFRGCSWIKKLLWKLICEHMRMNIAPENYEVERQRHNKLINYYKGRSCPRWDSNPTAFCSLGEYSSN